MPPRRRCPVCQSNKWHKEPSSGLIACSEGHVLQNYRNEAAEADELGMHTVRTRALKSGRKKKEQGSKADPKLYHGARARYHYFQCLQLLLRKQVLALIGLWNLPNEFEIICRDIWALHLSLLPTPPPAEPFLYLQEIRGDTQVNIPPIVTLDAEWDSDSQPQEGNISDEQNELVESSESSSSDDGDNEDPEMAELLRENSAPDSSSDEGLADMTSKAPAPVTQKTRTRGSLERYDSPASNIAVLIVACWTMRIPVVCADFRKIIESHALPCLDPLRLLPDDMILHLSRNKIQELSPHHTPSTIFLQKLASRLAKLMYSVHGIRTPEMNAGPVLWRTVRSLGGNPTLYNLTKQLARILLLPLTLHHSLSPNLKRDKKRDPDSHKFDNVPPELAFAATCVVVLKMAYGLDGKTRLPHETNDPACTLPRLEEYLTWLNTLNDADYGCENAKFSSDTQLFVGDLSEHEMDNYLDFCERALLKTEDDKAVERNILVHYFPVKRGNVDAGGLAASGLQAPVYPILRANTLNEDDNEDAALPGQAYTIYNPQDVLGTLPVEYEKVLSRAAHVVEVPDDYLSAVIDKFEHRIMRWWDGEKKRHREALKEEEEEEDDK